MWTHIFLKMEGKTLFQEYPDRCGWGLNFQIINLCGVHLTWLECKMDCRGTKKTLQDSIACMCCTCACLISNHMMENEIFHFIEADLFWNKRSWPELIHAQLNCL